MTAPSPGLARLHQIAQRVHDTPRAVAFYRDTLGLRCCSRRRPAWRSSTAPACG